MALVRYSEKATKFWKISTLLLSVYTVGKSKVEISQNFVAFSEYVNILCFTDLETCINYYFALPGRSCEKSNAHFS